MALGKQNIQDSLHSSRCLQKWQSDQGRGHDKTITDGESGEVISVKKPPITYSFKILNAIENRVGAKLISEVYENVTDPKQYELLEMSRISGFIDRQKGTGRPTKKDRRAMDAFVDPLMFGWDDDDEMFDDED